MHSQLLEMLFTPSATLVCMNPKRRRKPHFTAGQLTPARRQIKSPPCDSRETPDRSGTISSPLSVSSPHTLE
eukprot:scaffold1505_cov256-Pinguiococcus_pyrenoidosus.AAC.15